MASISGLTAYADYSSMYGYSTGVQENSSDVTAEKLQSTLESTDLKNASDEELLDACKTFENYLVEQVMKESENMIKALKNDDDEDDYLSKFGDTLMQEYSKMITDSGSLGIAQKLYDSLKRNQGL